MSSAPDPGPDNATLPTTALLAASMTERASSPWTGTYTSGALALTSLRSAGTLAPYPYLVGHGGAFRAGPAPSALPAGGAPAGALPSLHCLRLGLKPRRVGVSTAGGVGAPHRRCSVAAGSL